jgi:hypothetical protein
MMYCQDHAFLVELVSTAYIKHNVDNFLHIVAT